MKMPASCACACFLLPRICDTAHVRLGHPCAPVHTDCLPPQDACFVSGALSGCPVLHDIQLLPDSRGTLLRARLHLPVDLCFVCGCEQRAFSGVLCPDIQTVLRTPCALSLQLFPQAELRIGSGFVQNGCLCAEFDLQLCLYAAQLQPVQLPAPCPEPPKPDCAPFFHLPLYPELPPRKM